jgi:protein involved in polysaccharide export with SLBB domain
VRDCKSLKRLVQLIVRSSVHLRMRIIIIACKEATMGFLSSIRKIQSRYQILAMKPIALFVVLVAGGLLAGQSMAQQESNQPEYKLGPGDQIFIDVFGEGDLSMEIWLNDAGQLNYPYLGAIQVLGLSITELEQLLTAGLKGEYLIDPDVTVSILAYRHFYLNGEVNSPGGFPYQPGLTLGKAIAVGGGFTARASKGKITVIRANDRSFTARPIELNDPVQPGDVITVSERFF